MRDDEKDERKNFFISENFSALHALNSDDMHDDDDDYEYPILITSASVASCYRARIRIFWIQR